METAKRLFHVQDSDRDAYVVADNYETALRVWREQIQRENPDDPDECVPLGISMIADDNDLIIVARHEPAAPYIFNGLN